MTGAAPMSALAFARWSIEAAVRSGREAISADVPAAPDGWGGVFVTLHKFGRLRGCMGCLDTRHSFAECVRGAAIDAALGDPRFPPVAAGELPDLRIDVSVMSVPERTSDPLSLELGKHGVLIRRDKMRGLFLPQVAVDHRLDVVAFLSRCCSEKAGLPPDAWRDPATEVMFFTTTVETECEA